MLIQHRRLKHIAAFLPLALAFTPAPAIAHVKWFCAFDVAGAPVGLETVLCADFEQLVALSLCLLVIGCIIEGTPLGTALLRSLDSMTGMLRKYTETIVRAVAGGFFLAVGTTMNVFLTPELTSDIIFVPWMQIGMAATMLSRRTLPLASLGIVLLFGLSVAQYGMFHLLDYPVFLGLAAYFACIGFGCSPLGIRPLDLVRWAAAITLMWASVEKWAYPQWTFPMFVTHPNVSLGFDPAFYMQAAGVVEFALAFALLWTPLVRRCSAIILGAAFVAAIGEFGVVDAIGHSCIIAVMLAIAADDAKALVRRRTVLLMPVGYSAALTGFLAAYYSLHSILFTAGAS